MSKVTRREFIKIGGAVAAGAAVGSSQTADAMELEKGENSFNYARTAKKREVAYTVSPFGKHKTPIEVYLEDGERVVAAAGHPGHPAVRGRTSVLDAVSYMVAEDPDRILQPLRRSSERGGGKWTKISWEEALKEIAGKIDLAIAEKGEKSICMVRGEDTEDSLLARFMDTLGSSSTFEVGGGRNKRTAQKLTWGEESETPDFANSDYILNFGSNLFETFPAFAQALADGRTDNHKKLVTLDPRLSMTAGKSDEWLPVKPGTDGLVALAMANVIMEEGLADRAFINRWTNYPAEKLAEHLSQFTADMAEEESGISADTIRRVAIEFASAKSATVFTYRGASSHTNGVQTERACMLLPIITGNVEVKGGYCLPRRIAWNEAGPSPKPAGKRMETTFPLDLKSGSADAGVLLFCRTNPAYSSTAAAYWKAAFTDEKKVPFSVALTSHMTETAVLCDMILPEAVFLESSEPVSSPSSLFPWLGAITPVSEAPDEVRPLAIILRDIIHALDPEGDKGLQKYWEFEEHEEWMEKYFEAIPGLDEEGGYDAIVESGVWPSYGELDVETGRLLDDDENLPEAKYGLHKEKGFATPSKKIEIFSHELKQMGLEPLPVWSEAENLKSEEEGLVLVTYKTAYQCGSVLANNKYLAEKSHNNPCMINKEKAKELNIGDGDLIRISTPAGHLITKARVTNAIHPDVVAIAGGFGHKGVGRVADAAPETMPVWAEGKDADVHYNLWWRDNGVHPNDIIPHFIDPAGGGSAYACTVKVEKLKGAGSYGEVKVDLASHEAFFRKAKENSKA